LPCSELDKEIQTKIIKDLNKYSKSINSTYIKHHLNTMHKLSSNLLYHLSKGRKKYLIINMGDENIFALLSPGASLNKTEFCHVMFIYKNISSEIDVLSGFKTYSLEKEWRYSKYYTFNYNDLNTMYYATFKYSSCLTYLSSLNINYNNNLIYLLLLNKSADLAEFMGLVRYLLVSLMGTEGFVIDLLYNKLTPYIKSKALSYVLYLFFNNFDKTILTRNIEVKQIQGLLTSEFTFTIHLPFLGEETHSIQLFLTEIYLYKLLPKNHKSNYHDLKDAYEVFKTAEMLPDANYNFDLNILSQYSKSLKDKIDISEYKQKSNSFLIDETKISSSLGYGKQLGRKLTDVIYETILKHEKKEEVRLLDIHREEIISYFNTSVKSQCDKSREINIPDFITLCESKYIDKFSKYVLENLEGDFIHLSGEEKFIKFQRLNDNYLHLKQEYPYCKLFSFDASKWSTQDNIDSLMNILINILGKTSFVENHFQSVKYRRIIRTKTNHKAFTAIFGDVDEYSLSRGWPQGLYNSLSSIKHYLAYNRAIELLEYYKTIPMYNRDEDRSLFDKKGYYKDKVKNKAFVPINYVIEFAVHSDDSMSKFYCNHEKGYKLWYRCILQSYNEFHIKLNKLKMGISENFQEFLSYFNIGTDTVIPLFKYTISLYSDIAPVSYHQDILSNMSKVVEGYRIGLPRVWYEFSIRNMQYIVDNNYLLLPNQRNYNNYCNYGYPLEITGKFYANPVLASINLLEANNSRIYNTYEYNKLQNFHLDSHKLSKPNLYTPKKYKIYSKVNKIKRDYLIDPIRDNMKDEDEDIEIDILNKFFISNTEKLEMLRRYYLSYKCIISYSSNHSFASVLARKIAQSSYEKGTMAEEIIHKFNNINTSMNKIVYYYNYNLLFKEIMLNISTLNKDLINYSQVSNNSYLTKVNYSTYIRMIDYDVIINELKKRNAIDNIPNSFKTLYSILLKYNHESHISELIKCPPWFIMDLIYKCNKHEFYLSTNIPNTLIKSRYRDEILINNFGQWQDADTVYTYPLLTGKNVKSIHVAKLINNIYYAASLNNNSVKDIINIINESEVKIDETYENIISLLKKSKLNDVLTNFWKYILLNQTPKKKLSTSIRVRKYIDNKHFLINNVEYKLDNRTVFINYKSTLKVPNIYVFLSYMLIFNLKQVNYNDLKNIIDSLMELSSDRSENSLYYDKANNEFEFNAKYNNIHCIKRDSFTIPENIEYIEYLVYIDHSVDIDKIYLSNIFAYFTYGLTGKNINFETYMPGKLLIKHSNTKYIYNALCRNTHNNKLHVDIRLYEEIKSFIDFSTYLKYLDFYKLPKQEVVEEKVMPIRSVEETLNLWWDARSRLDDADLESNELNIMFFHADYVQFLFNEFKIYGYASKMKNLITKEYYNDLLTVKPYVSKEYLDKYIKLDSVFYMDLFKFKGIKSNDFSEFQLVSVGDFDFLEDFIENYSFKENQDKKEFKDNVVYKNMSPTLNDYKVAINLLYKKSYEELCKYCYVTSINIIKFLNSTKTNIAERKHILFINKQYMKIQENLIDKGKFYNLDIKTILLEMPIYKISQMQNILEVCIIKKHFDDLKTDLIHLGAKRVIYIKWLITNSIDNYIPKNLSKFEHIVKYIYTEIENLSGNEIANISNMEVYKLYQDTYPGSINMLIDKIRDNEDMIKLNEILEMHKLEFKNYETVKFITNIRYSSVDKTDSWILVDDNNYNALFTYYNKLPSSGEKFNKTFYYYPNCDVADGMKFSLEKDIIEIPNISKETLEKIDPSFSNYFEYTVEYEKLFYYSYLLPRVCKKFNDKLYLPMFLSNPKLLKNFPDPPGREIKYTTTHTNPVCVQFKHQKLMGQHLRGVPRYHVPDTLGEASLELDGIINKECKLKIKEDETNRMGPYCYTSQFIIVYDETKQYDDIPCILFKDYYDKILLEKLSLLDDIQKSEIEAKCKLVQGKVNQALIWQSPNKKLNKIIEIQKPHRKALEQLEEEANITLMHIHRLSNHASEISIYNESRLEKLIEEFNIKTNKIWQLWKDLSKLYPCPDEIKDWLESIQL